MGCAGLKSLAMILIGLISTTTLWVLRNSSFPMHNLSVNCQVPKKSRTRLTQCLWLLPALLAHPYPNPLQPRDWALLHFPSNSFLYKPAILATHSPSYWLASSWLLCLLGSLSLSSSLGPGLLSWSACPLSLLSLPSFSPLPHSLMAWFSLTLPDASG